MHVMGKIEKKETEGRAIIWENNVVELNYFLTDMKDLKKASSFMIIPHELHFESYGQTEREKRMKKKGGGEGGEGPTYQRYYC